MKALDELVEGCYSRNDVETFWYGCAIHVIPDNTLCLWEMQGGRLGEKIVEWLYDSTFFLNGFDFHIQFVRDMIIIDWWPVKKQEGPK